MTRPLPKNVYRNNYSYIAVVRHKGKRHYLGSFRTPELAEERALLFREEHPIIRESNVWQPGDKLDG